MTHRFNPDHFAKLDDPERREWQNPDVLIDWLEVNDASTVADLGAGTGYFALPLAARYPDVTVYAVDISPKMLELLSERAAHRDIHNVRVLATEGRVLDLEDGVVDIFLMINVLHELADMSLVREARRTVGTGGRLVLVDWKKEETPAGPPIDERIDKSSAVALMAKYGFKQVAEADLYPYHYTVVLS